MHADGQAGAHYSGVERCASIWACPVCSAVIRAERAVEIQRAVEAHQATGGGVAMVTLTLRHRSGDDLGLLLDALLRGWQRLIAGAPWERQKARLGIAGFVRAVEVTWGGNGWHPHMHALVFTEGQMSEGAAAAFQGWVLDRWQGIVTRLGAQMPNAAHGVRVDRADGHGKVVAAYLAKVQEASRAKVGTELARFDLKTGRGGNLMPFELLDPVIRQDGDDDHAARVLWLTYQAATHGRRAITWSRGLRDRLGLDAERTDDEIIEDTEARVQLLTVPGPAYDRARAEPAVLAAVLDAVERGHLALAASIIGGTILYDETTGEVGLSPPQRAS